MGAPKKIAVIGSGMAGLTVASLLARDGAQVTVYEQNWMTGGCSSTYWRKGFWFETGATTLVGLDEGMPLHRLLQETGITLPAQKLETPMQVMLNGRVITRHQNLEAWIVEAEKHFGVAGQKAFWEECYRISLQVWGISSQQLAFPPQNLADLLSLAKGFAPHQLAALPAAFSTVEDLLRKHGLLEHREFVQFVDEQLMITAQNTHPEVNMLFGATALCYTNFGNYYLPGGLRQLVEPFARYIEQQAGEIRLRSAVRAITPHPSGLTIETAQSSETYSAVVSAIPLNNLAELLPTSRQKTAVQSKLLPSEKLSSALQLGIGFTPHRQYDCLHYQIHLPEGLPGLPSKSIFLSLHPANDTERAPQGQMAASVSTHWHNPANQLHENREALEQAVLNALEAHNLILKSNIVYLHSSGPASWAKWTGRKWGFVGGYPQYKAIKPWQMMGARLKKGQLYICGDATYPGQGIPGVVLSGLAAHHKMKLDGVI
jgi:C-3',4' desaturase CrtD